MTILSPSEGQHLLQFARQTAEEAGKIIMKFFGNLSSENIQNKGRRELVTEADKQSERYIVQQIEQYFPQHSILAEEFTVKEANEFCWHIDPLDGTTNFRHAYPLFSISMGLEIAQELVMGVVYAPYLREMFFALKGHGAFLNQTPIQVSPETQLINSLLSTGFGYNLNETQNNNIANFSRLLLESQGIRRGGSAALDLAYVACGRFDGYWELHLKPYDVAAGTVLVQEAGGKVTDFSGGNNFLYSGQILASNGKIHSLIQSRLDSILPE
ncbi:MAG: inositol monophosphatase family protein [Planctomycetota bacterium]